MRRVRPPGKRGQSWNTFIGDPSCDIWACDFLQLYDVLFRPIFEFFFMVHGTQEVVHFNMTRCATDAWAARQLREPTPYVDGPKYLIRDNDGKGSQHGCSAMATTPGPTAGSAVLSPCGLRR